MQSNKEVAKAIRARQKFIERVDRLIHNTAVGFGDLVRNYVGHSHTNTVWELKDFAGFMFVGNFGHTMMGGNSITVSYRGEEVLEVYYQSDIRECEVRKFLPGPWEKAITKLFKTYKAELERRAKAKTLALKKKKLEEKKRNSEKGLEKDAERLGLNNF